MIQFLIFLLISDNIIIKSFIFHTTSSKNNRISSILYSIQSPTPPTRTNQIKNRKRTITTTSNGEVEDIITSYKFLNQNYSAIETPASDKLTFPETSQSALDEKALRNSPLGKVIFSVIDVLFPVFREPNWFDIYGKLIIIYMHNGLCVLTCNICYKYTATIHLMHVSYICIQIHLYQLKRISIYLTSTVMTLLTVVGLYTYVTGRCTCVVYIYLCTYMHVCCIYLVICVYASIKYIVYLQF